MNASLRVINDLNIYGMATLGHSARIAVNYFGESCSELVNVRRPRLLRLFGFSCYSPGSSLVSRSTRVNEVAGLVDWRNEVIEAKIEVRIAKCLKPIKLNDGKNGNRVRS